MKKIIFLIAFLAVTLAANAQYDLIKRGIKVGNGGTKTLVDSTELKRIKEIDEKVSTASIVDYSATLYTKAEVDDLKYSHSIYHAWLKANGQSKLLGVPMFATNLLSSQRSGVDGNMYLSSIQMNKDTVITTLTVQMITQGAYTGDNYNGMVVYRTSASGITLAAKTTNDANCWTGATGTLVTKTLETPVSVTKGEIIMVGFHYNNSAQTTAPVIATYGTCGTYLYNLVTNNRKLTGVIATSTPGASYTWSSVFQNADIVGILPK